jgi:hypothetical protein
MKEGAKLFIIYLKLFAFVIQRWGFCGGFLWGISSINCGSKIQK